MLAADEELAALNAEAETATDPHRIAEIHVRLHDKEASRAQARAARLLAGLGFDEATQQLPCQSFSGGWRMRVALAALLFTEPDLLLLDEPTNHLDLEATLWLVQFLARWQHTLLVISHDRALLDRAATAVLNFEPNGKVTRYASRLQAMAATTKAEIPKPSPQKATKPSKPTPSRLSGTERRELEALPAKVEALETERDQLGERLADPALYRAEDGEAADLGAAFKRAEAAVTAAYARWEALEAQA